MQKLGSAKTFKGVEERGKRWECFDNLYKYHDSLQARYTEATEHLGQIIVFN